MQSVQKRLQKMFSQYFLKDMERFSLFYPVLLGGGIYAQTVFDFSHTVVAIIFGLLMISVFFWRKLTDFSKIFFIAVLIVVIGMVSYSVRLYSIHHDVLPYRTTGIVSGTVQSSLASHKKNQIILTDVKIDGVAFNGLVRLNVKKAVNRGATVSVRAMMFPPAKPIIKGAFDFRHYAYFKRIGAFGKGLGSVNIIKNTDLNFSHKITKAVYRHLPTDTAALSVALITANRLGISKDNTNILRGSGLAHLLAISGLHIGLVMGVIYFLVRFGGVLVFGNRSTIFSLKKSASICAVLVGFSYGWLAGFPIPTIRAFLMAVFVVLGVLSYRRVVTMRSVALVGSVILLFQPESLFSPSFQLSFGAVVGLVGVYEIGSFSVKGIKGFFYSVFLSSLIAMIFTMPFSIYHFGTVGVYSVVANMLAIPLMGFIIVPALMFGVIEVLIFDTSVLLNIGGFAIDILMLWAKSIYKLPSSVLTFSSGSGIALTMFSVGMYTLFVLKQKWRYGALIISVIGFFCLFLPTSPPLLYVLPKGKIVYLHGEVYNVSGRANKYLNRAIKSQTGIDVLKGDVCKQDICVKGFVALILGKELPKNICSTGTIKNHQNEQIFINNKDSFSNKNIVREKIASNVETDDKTTPIQLIIAPNIFIKRCKIASIDKMDLYLNGSHTVYSDLSISVVEPTGKHWEK